MIVWICGSREASDKMILVARNYVYKANENGWRIIVGDAPGIDEAVCQEAERINAACNVYGVTPQPRNGGVNNLRSCYINLSATTLRSGIKNDNPCSTYQERDEFLAKFCSNAVFIWNGDSPGTHRAYSYFSSNYPSKSAKFLCFEANQLKENS